jgi:hypothetical protein
MFHLSTADIVGNAASLHLLSGVRNLFQWTTKEAVPPIWGTWGTSLPKSEASGVTGATLERNSWNWGRTEKSKLETTNLGGTNWGEDGGATDKAQTAADEKAGGPIIVTSGDGAPTGRTNRRTNGWSEKDPKGKPEAQEVVK